MATDLTRLLETERRLAARLESARAEAEELVARAKLLATEREAALEAELARDESLLVDRLTGERHQREEEIAEAAQRDIDKFRGVSERSLAKLARTLSQRLLADGDDS